LTTPAQSHLLPGPHAAGSPQDGNPQCLYPARVDYARKSTAPTPADAHHRGPPVTGAPGLARGPLGQAGDTLAIRTARPALQAHLTPAILAVHQARQNQSQYRGPPRLAASVSGDGGGC